VLEQLAGTYDCTAAAAAAALRRAVHYSKVIRWANMQPSVRLAAAAAAAAAASPHPRRVCCLMALLLPGALGDSWRSHQCCAQPCLPADDGRSS
jgi:hypothetical protein